MSTETETAFEPGWCVLELMGHRRLGGYVREVSVAGAGLLRIDIPETGGVPTCTQFYAPSALYCITPTTEEVARGIASRAGYQPVQRYELPEEIPSRPPREDDDVDPDSDLDQEYREY